MKISKYLTAIALMIIGSAGVWAQEPASATQESAAANAQHTQNEWYVNTDFDGMNFQLPGGIQIERGSAFLAKYPDGTFGVSMEKINKSATKKVALNLCERLADSLHIPRAGVKKVSFGKAKGAKAQGIIEGKLVTCIVLAYDDHQLQIVIMADKNREAWVKHFLNTLNK